LSQHSEEKVNQAAKYRNLAAFQRLRMFVQAAEKSPLSPLILKLKTNGVRDRVLGYFRKPESGMAMLPGTRKRLVEFYQKPNIELEKILNVSLDRWN
jgi:hypothetical protein